METNSDGSGARVLLTARTLRRILRAPQSVLDTILLAVALGPPRAYHATRGEAPEPKWRSLARARKQRAAP